MSDAIVGTEVDGYRIESVLGRGGMGTVYKAEDVNLSRTVAIKRINPGQQDRESFIHRFRAEAQALARIDSSNIVGVYALRDTDVGLLIVMEYVEGGTLKDPIERQGALEPGRAVPILEQTLEAFGDAHEEGVIHRDIKPENVMLTTEGIVKVTDFGIAKLRQPDSGETVTQGGQGGTLKYMSPEQISNISAVDARSDIYSLGMTAYKVLAGTLPFTESDTDFDIMRKVVEGEIPPPEEFNADIPFGLVEWIMGAIEKQQDERYQSAEEMLEALRDAHQQSGDHTMTQPEWEVDDGSADVDQTQTAPPDEDQTQTVVPGEDADGDAPPVESGGETVIDPDPAMEDGATQPAVPSPSVESDDTEEDDAVEPSDDRDADEASGDDSGMVTPAPSAEPETTAEDAEPADQAGAPEQEETNWGAIGGGIVGILILAIGGYLAVTQTGDAGGTVASATLSLGTTPEGATVLVNNDTVGTTPLSGHTLGAGPAQLQVQKEGFVPLDTTLTVEKGETVSLTSITLARTSDESSEDETETSTVAEDQQREPAETTEPTSPAGGDPAGSEPTAEASGTAEQEGAKEQASASRGPEAADESAVEEESSPAVGTVDVTPNPSGTLLVDGEKKNSTSVEVTTGEHTIGCQHPEHGSVETTLTITEGQTEKLTCYFEQKVSVNTNGAFGRIWLNGTNTGKNTNAASPLSLTPGTHRLEVRRRSIDGFEVDGGVVKITQGDDSRTKNFSGGTYELQVEPSFEKVKHAVVFNVKTQ